MCFRCSSICCCCLLTCWLSCAILHGAETPFAGFDTISMSPRPLDALILQDFEKFNSGGPFPRHGSRGAGGVAWSVSSCPDIALPLTVPSASSVRRQRLPAPPRRGCASRGASHCASVTSLEKVPLFFGGKMLDAFVWYLDVPFYDPGNLIYSKISEQCVEQRITLFVRIEMESIL